MNEVIPGEPPAGEETTASLIISVLLVGARLRINADVDLKGLEKLEKMLTPYKAILALQASLTPPTQEPRLKRPPVCAECDNLSDPPFALCPGCQAYSEHQS